MRQGDGRWVVVWAAATVLLLFGAGSATAAKPAASGASGAWGTGVEAALPANADPNSTGGAEIFAISCPSAGNCGAVGEYRDNAGSWDGLLLTETDGNWSVGVEAVMPANVAAKEPGGLVGSISCSSAGNCTAVGYYVDDSGAGQGLLLTQTAGTWSTGVEAALPSNAKSSNPYGTLSSVSCASAGNCSAVGTYYDNGSNRQGLLLTETAGSWATGVEAELPADAGALQLVSLASVSCASAGDCSAVGSYSTGSTSDEGLLLNETAGTWQPGVEASLPAGAATTGQEAGLSSVSCASAGNCSAVGWYDGMYVSLSRIGPTVLYAKGLLLTETAGSWAGGVQAALPANADGSQAVASLNSVSCPSAGNCSAAGTYYDNNSGVQGLLLTEIAGSWAAAVEALPANAPSTEPDPYDGGVGSVSCASPGNCGAVATEGDVLTQSAGNWATGEAPPLPANTASPGMLLFSVSCPSVGSCTAVGAYGTGSTGEGLLIGGSPAAVKLEISTIGSGSGTVTSTPTGIDCGSTCSASYDAGTSLMLTAVPSARSQFSGWSGGGCSGTGSCQPNMSISDQTVTATFDRVPLNRLEIPEAQPRRCVVPRLKGKTLSAAESAIRSHDCAVGTIRRAFSRLVQKGHVISQSPEPGKRLQPGTSVDLVVSRGRR